jgi:hypothetical protein
VALCDPIAASLPSLRAGLAVCYPVKVIHS